MNSKSEKLKLPTYGGQALIEGVLMRGSHALAAAMRAPDGKIVIKTEKLGGIYQSPIRKIPFLRGLILLWDALGLGMGYLVTSANLQTGEEEEIKGPVLYITLFIAIAVGIGLFFVIPAAIGQWVENGLQIGSWWSNLFEGVVRLLILVAYMWSIGKLPDVKRVFSYHGAEHKTINAFESNLELIPEEVKKASIVHPRCGTSFLLTLVLLSIIFFSILGPMPTALRLISRVVLLPVIAGIAYEYIRWASNHLESPFVKFLIQPNLALQRLTTHEPTLDMIEVAISAFNAMLEKERQT